MENFANTIEQAKYLNQYEYIFTNDYFVRKVTIRLSANYMLTVEHYNHSYAASEKSGYSISCQKLSITDHSGRQVFQKKYCFGYEFHQYIVHSNQQEYFISGHDLLQYSVFNLTTGNESQFISGRVIFQDYTDDSRSYFWYISGLLYNPKNNLLAINGQDSMNGMTTVICDFSQPEMLPLNARSLGSLSDDGTVHALSWTESGHLKIGAGEDNYQEIELEENLIISLLKAGDPWAFPT